MGSYPVTKFRSKPSKWIDVYLIFKHVTWILGEWFNIYNALFLLNQLNVRRDSWLQVKGKHSYIGSTCSSISLYSSGNFVLSKLLWSHCLIQDWWLEHWKVLCVSTDSETVPSSGYISDCNLNTALCWQGSSSQENPTLAYAQQKPLNMSHARVM